LLQRDIQMRVHGEVLGMLMSRVNTVQKSLNVRRLHLNDQVQGVLQEAKIAEAERERETLARKKDEQLAERDRILERAKSRVEEVSALFSDINTKADIDFTQEENPAVWLQDLAAAQSTAEAKAKEGIEFLQDEMAKMSSCDFSTADIKMQFHSHINKLKKMGEGGPNIDAMMETFFVKEREQLTYDVADYLTQKSISETKLFEELQSGGVVTKDRFLALFQTSLPFDEGLDLQSFKMLVGNYWVAVRGGILTSELCVTSSRKVRDIKAYEFFRAMGPPVEDESTSAMRLKVRIENNDAEASFDEGWISQKQGQTYFCKPLPKMYTLKVGTVVTDKPELTQLKVIKRLKVGEMVKPVSLPVVSKLLMRVRGKCQDGMEGWFTLVDFQKKTSFVNEFEGST